MNDQTETQARNTAAYFSIKIKEVSQEIVDAHVSTYAYCHRNYGTCALRSLAGHNLMLAVIHASRRMCIHAVHITIIQASGGA